MKRVPDHLRKRDYSRGTPLERAMRRVRVDDETGCWEWNGSKVPAGYGHLNVGGGHYRHAHSVIYEGLVGPIPEGLQLDHLCRNRGCVNPEHLEPVSHRENVLRGSSPLVVAHREGRCVRGHPASEAVLRRGTARVVYCKACRRERRATARTGAA